VIEVEARTLKASGHQYAKPAQGVQQRDREYGMVTVIAIIVADLLVLLLFLYQYRQETGLTVNGAHDLPVLRKKPASKAVAHTGAADGQANRGQQVVTRR
jgi:hypothetical protein